MSARPLWPRMALALLGVLGALNAVYLSIHRWQPVRTAPIQCGVVGDCQAVQASPYSVFPPGNGVPVAYVGLLGFIMLLVLSLLMLGRDWVGPVPLPSLLVGIASLGALFSGYLTAVEAFVLRQWCQWCVVSASLMLLFWMVALVDWRGWRTESSAEEPAAPDGAAHNALG